MADEAPEADVAEEVAVDSPVEESGASEVAAEPEGSASESVSPLSVFRQIPGLESATDEEIVSQLQQSVQRERQAYHALQQYQTIIPAASEYLSNREMYEQWKQSRGQQAAPAPASAAPAPSQQQESWWNPPKIKEAYRQYIQRDDQGREVISENAPMEARHALAEYQAYKADFARKFLEDPQGALGPMIEKIVSDRAQQIAESQISGLKEETFVQQVEAENRDWLYDQTGNVSREGLLVQKYIEDARAYGIAGAKARWDFATAMVERDLALANLQAMQPPQVPQQAPAMPPGVPPQQAQPSAAQKNMDFLRQQATRNTARRAQPNTDPRTPKKPTTFAERMMANLQGKGFDE